MQTATLTHYLASALTGLLLAATTAAAQTTPPPAWTFVRAVSAGPNLLTQAGAHVSAVQADGTFYAVGSFTGTTSVGGFPLVAKGSSDGYVARYTEEGNVLWVRQLGSAGMDAGRGVAVDAAGNAYVTGQFVGAVDLGNGLALNDRGTTQSKTFCIRYSPNGVAQWVQQSNDLNYSEGSGIGVDASGHVYLTGIMTGFFVLGSSVLNLPDNFTSNTAYLARLSAATGQVEALTAAFSYGSGSNFAPLLAVAPGGTRVYLLPHFESRLLLPGGNTLSSAGNLDVGVLAYTATGQLEWARQLGSPQRDEAAQATTDAAGNLYVVGHSLGSVRAGLFTLPNNSGTDGYLLKYDLSGEVQWAQPVNSPGNDQLQSVAVTPNGAAYVTGSFEQTLTIGTQRLTSAGQRDVLVAAYSPTGQPRWAQQAGGPGPDYGSYLGLGFNGSLNLVGSYSAPATFGQQVLTAPAPNGTFVALLGGVVLGTNSARPLALALAPNPATSRVRLIGLPAAQPVQVFDPLGRLVRTATLAPDASFSVQGLAPGLYLVRAVDAQNRAYAGRLVVE
ncbi:SBBP repeat-containing protein [Hymenobacter psychrophilus]|uniref:Por secretion system C-terminal sorting domain-containing protein n=1 Tax=Hymenobacter psychrophilus TaxID=651662 RepID=A0A1H3B4P4_9BACT|nr:SBBP repeat-containing protein [Hymenobacter psychrophilus]SDX36765.1 Por secretion system C-terminal sorting domain-containing protein [Hymenobacter psychrophilus]